MGRRRQAHCARGHPLSGDNLYTGPRGDDRRCRRCIRIQGGHKPGRGPGRPRQKLCGRGLHRMSGKNVYVAPDGTRSCRACKRERAGTMSTKMGRPFQKRCQCGHPLKDPNLYYSADGSRSCRACKVQYERGKAAYRRGHKPTCCRGHALIPGNLYWAKRLDKQGNTRKKRICKTCLNLRERLYRIVRNAVLAGWDVDEAVERCKAYGFNMEAFAKTQQLKLERDDEWQLARKRLKVARSEMSRLGLWSGKHCAWPSLTPASRPEPTSRT